MCVPVCVCHFKVARERPRGAGGGPRSEGPSREPCRAEWGPHSRRHRHRRRVGWEGREPPPPPPPPGWAPFAVDAGGPGRGKGGPGGGLGPPPPPPHLRPRAGGAAPAPHCATRGGGGGRRTRSRHPRTSLVCVPGPVSPLGARGWAPAWVSLPAAPLRRSRPLAAVCARIFVVVMRVDECEVGGHLPSHQDWQKKKKKKKRNPELGGVQRAAAAAASRRRFPRRPRLLLPEAGGCARGGRPRSRPSARRAAGTIRPDPPGPGVRARGALRLRGGGEGRAGVRGETGARAARGPQGSGPCWPGIPRGAPGAQVKDGKGGEVEPFCFAGPALLAPPGSRATSAAVATTTAPGSARQSRSGAGARGGPGGGRGRGPGGPGIFSARPRSRGHHFLLARRRREPGPPASPAPTSLFGWGEPKRKSFAGGAGEGAPGAAGTRRCAATAGPPRSPLPPCPPRRWTDPRGRGEAPLFLSLALFPAPRGKLGRGAREPGRAGAFLQREAPRRGRSPAAHAAPWCWEAAGPGARRGHRWPRRDTHAHTLPPVARFPPSPMVTDTECACARECVGAPPSPPPSTFSGGGLSSSWLQGVPTFSILREKGGIFRRNPRLLCVLAVEAAGSGLRRHAGLTCPTRLALSGVNRSFWIPILFSLKIGDQVKFLESQI